MQQIYTKKLAWNFSSKNFLVLFTFSFFICGTALAQTPADEKFDDNPSFENTSNDFSLDGVRYRISGNGTIYSHATFDATFNLSEGGTGDFALQFDKNGNGGISSITISTIDGSAFQIARMSMDILSETPVQFTSDQGGSFSLSPNDGAYVLHKNYDFTARSGFDNITNLTLSGTNMVIDIDDVDFEPAVSPVDAPTLTTGIASSISGSGVTLNGDITSDGGASVTGRGFIYSSSDNTPTIGESEVIQVSVGNGTGTFEESISGLSGTTTYYYQAYATNSEGTSYGGVESFTTLVPHLENFSWSADNLNAGATGVTYTFSYTTVTDVGPSYEMIFYAIQRTTTNGLGWDFSGLTTSDISVTIDGAPFTVSSETYFLSDGSGAGVRLTSPVPGGSDVVVTIRNVSNNATPGTYSWFYMRTALGSGHAIDKAANPDPIVLTTPTATGAIIITDDLSDPASDWLLSGGKLIPLVDGAKVNVNEVTNALASGDLTIEAQTDVFIDANIAPSLSAERTLTIKADRDVNLEANSSIAATDFALNTILWSDADASEGGVAYLKTEAEILSHGGHLWIGGGSGNATWNGLSVGDGTSIGNLNNSNGITLVKTNIQTDGGNIAFYGRGLIGSNAGIPTPISTGYSTNTNGIRMHDGNSIDAGSGTIYMYGFADNNYASSNANGVELSHTLGAPDLITSSNNTEDAIFIEGYAEGPSTVANSWGFYTHLSTVQNTGGGNIHLKGSAVKNSAVTVAGDGAILASGGKIILEGIAAGGTNPSVLVQGAIGQKANTQVTSSDADIEIIGDRFSVTGNAPNGSIQSSGVLSIRPYTNGIDISLGSAAATLQLPASYFNTNFADGFSEVVIGDENTGVITVESKMLYQDPLTLKTNGNIVFSADADVSSITANALTLWTRANGNNEANDANFGAIWMPQGSSINTAGGNLTMGGGSDPYTGYAMGDPSAPSAENNAIYRGVAMNGSIDAAGGNIIINGKAASASNVSHARGVNIAGPVATVGAGNITVRGIGRGGSDAIALGDSYFTPDAVGTLKAETGNITMDGKPSGSTRNGLNVSTSGSYIKTNGNFSATTTGRIIATAGALDISGTTHLEAADNIKLTHADNDFGGSITVNAANNLQLTDQNDLTLGEIGASGTIEIATFGGDLTVSGNISTANATAEAIRIFADKTKDAGDPSGGNIKISGTPAISTGTGGQARFYSGSVLESADLISLTGGENIRYEVDARTTVFTPNLGSGSYALIREKESFPVIISNPMIYQRVK